MSGFDTTALRRRRASTTGRTPRRSLLAASVGLVAASVLGCDPAWYYRIHVVAAAPMPGQPRSLGGVSVRLDCPDGRMEARAYQPTDPNGEGGVGGIGFGVPSDCTITLQKPGYDPRAYRVADFCQDAPKPGELCRWGTLHAELEAIAPVPDVAPAEAPAPHAPDPASTPPTSPAPPEVEILAPSAQEQDLIEARERVCKRDSDCARIEVTCCPCSGMGHAGATRRDAVRAIRRRLAQHCGNKVKCLAALSPDPSCRARVACIEDRCRLVVP